MTEETKSQKITLTPYNIEDVALWLDARSYSLTYFRTRDVNNELLYDFEAQQVSFTTESSMMTVVMGETLVRGSDPIAGDFIAKVPVKPPVLEEEIPLEEESA